MDKATDNTNTITDIDNMTNTSTMTNIDNMKDMDENSITYYHSDSIVYIGPTHNPECALDYDYCIYHGPCSDGLMAAWASQLKYPNILMMPQSPGCKHLFNKAPLDTFSGKRVMFVDICPVKEVLMQMLSVCAFVLVLDHHETNKDLITSLVTDNIPTNLNVMFDMDRAGCHIVWDYFYYNYYDNKKTPRPWFLEYIGDGDLWYPSEKQSPNPLPNGRLIVKGLNECGHLDSRETIQALYTSSGNRSNMAHCERRDAIINNQLIPMGKMMKNNVNKMIASIMKRAYMMEYTTENGSRYYAWMVNSSDHTINSDLGHQLLDHPIILSTRDNNTNDITYHYPGASIEGLDYLQAATFNKESDVDNEITNEIVMPAFSVIVRGYDPVTHSLIISMRGGKEYSPNLAKLCSRFGGGGHSAASGALIPLIDFRTCFHAIKHT